MLSRIILGMASLRRKKSLRVSLKFRMQRRRFKELNFAINNVLFKA